MKRLTEIILTVAVILVMSFITGQCYGEQVIYGCYNQKTGALRIVNSLTQCSRNETRLSWNQTGLQGPQGVPGSLDVSKLYRKDCARPEDDHNTNTFCVCNDPNDVLLSGSGGIIPLESRCVLQNALFVNTSCNSFFTQEECNAYGLTDIPGFMVSEINLDQPGYRCPSYLIINMMCYRVD